MSGDPIIQNALRLMHIRPKSGFMLPKSRTDVHVDKNLSCGFAVVVAIMMINLQQLLLSFLQFLMQRNCSTSEALPNEIRPAHLDNAHGVETDVANA